MCYKRVSAGYSAVEISCCRQYEYQRFANTRFNAHVFHLHFLLGVTVLYFDGVVQERFDDLAPPRWFWLHFATAIPCVVANRGQLLQNLAVCRGRAVAKLNFGFVELVRVGGSDLVL